MSYKQERRNGRMVTIDTRTGEEVGPFQGPIGDFVNDIKTMGRITLSDIKNLKRDIGGHLIYSDTAVDKNGRQLTRAQAGEVTGPNRDARLQDILGTAPQTPSVKKAIQTLDPKRVPDAGVDTSTGKVTPKPAEPKTFQELQQGLMGDIAKRYTDPQTAALIRGGPVNPYSSNQLPYTDDSLYTRFGAKLDLDLGIDASKMLQRAGNVDYSATEKSLTGFPEGLALKDSFIEGYVSPVNGNAPQNAGNPMLNPNIDSMDAMRMKDRDLGLMYASGQFFAEGKDGKPVLVNRELAKSVRRGDAGAADELAAYLTGDGVKPQGGVITDPKRSLMAPPKTEETQIKPTPGESPSYSSISTVDFANTGGFSPNMSSSFLNTEPDMPEMSKKLGLSYNNPEYSDLLYRKTGAFDPFSSKFNTDLFKD